MTNHDETKRQLEKAIFGVMYKCGAFYGCVLNAMQVVIGEMVPTAGVRFTKEENTLELAINPEFFEKLSEQERVALVLHEALHVLHLHILDREDHFTDKQIGNVAMDLAINHIIASKPENEVKLPDSGLLPSKYGLPVNKPAEFYYDELMQQQPPQQPQGGGQQQSGGDQGQGHQQNGQPQSGKGKRKSKAAQQAQQNVQSAQTLDDHAGWDSNKPMTQKVDAVKNVLQRAKERAAQMAGCDKVPSEVDEKLNILAKMKVKQWHKVLAKFVAHHTDGADRVRSWSRRNKRYGLWEAGTKCGPSKRLIIGVDTSGSMSEADICQALAEAKSMLKCDVEAEVWFFDTQVNAKVKLKKQNEFQVGGRGGTDYQDFFDQAQKKKPDAVVVFTDLDDGHTMQKAPLAPILWVLTAGPRPNAYSWGVKVVLDK